MRWLLVFLLIGCAEARPPVEWKAKKVTGTAFTLEARMGAGWKIHEASRACVRADTCVDGAVAISPMARERREISEGDTLYEGSAKWLVTTRSTQDMVTVHWAACDSVICLPRAEVSVPVR